jgi:hypothetical protein
MLTMSLSAVYLSTFVRPIPVNVVAGSLTAYLVTTARVAGGRREKKVGRFDVIAMLVAAAIGIGAWTYGLQQTVPQHGVPTAIYFIFGSIALLFSVSDVRTYLRGGVTGTKRIVRHLWRMCLALLIATMSFYPGQAKLFPKSWRESGLLWTPLLVLLALTIYYLIRVQIRRKSEKARTTLHVEPAPSPAG